MLEREVATLLICACCGAPMTLEEAQEAPPDVRTDLYYHRDFQACVRVAMGKLAEAKPVMKAFLGATDAT